MLLLFKLLVTPVFVGAATLAGRRWGPVVNGLVVGLPLTTGPISLILAHQCGLAFAAQAAAGNLAGQISMCVFCLVYSRAAARTGWRWSAGLALTAYLATTAGLNTLSWRLWPALTALLTAISVAVWAIPRHARTAAPPAPPRWDLPARIIVATSFVLLLTTIAEVLGPQLSGLISTFPIFGVVFAAFTHAQQGPAAVANLLRGLLFGSVSYAVFFLTVGLALITLGPEVTYGLAVLAALGVSGLFYRLTQAPAAALPADAHATPIK